MEELHFFLSKSAFITLTHRGLYLKLLAPPWSLLNLVWGSNSSCKWLALRTYNRYEGFYSFTTRSWACSWTSSYLWLATLAWPLTRHVVEHVTSQYYGMVRNRRFVGEAGSRGQLYKNGWAIFNGHFYEKSTPKRLNMSPSYQNWSDLRRHNIKNVYHYPDCTYIKKFSDWDTMFHCLTSPDWISNTHMLRR